MLSRSPSIMVQGVELGEGFISFRVRGFELQ